MTVKLRLILVVSPQLELSLLDDVRPIHCQARCQPSFTSDAEHPTLPANCHQFHDIVTPSSSQTLTASEQHKDLTALLILLKMDGWMVRV